MILAIDQGSSKTVAALVNPEGTIVSKAFSGGACYFSSSVEKAFREIDVSAKEAMNAAGVGGVDRIYAGIAGANWPDEIEMLTGEMHRRFPAPAVTVRNDCVAALRGGTDKRDGIVLCAGSGLNAAVMINGKVIQVLNNYVDDNDQGGGALGNRAMEAVFESQAGIRGDTVLTERLLDFFGCSTVDELIVGRDHRKLRYPMYTAVEILMRAADENDETALDVVYEFSVSVARYVTGSMKKFGLVGKDCDIVLSGGVFKSYNPLFRETIAVAVHRISRQAAVINAKYEPIVGAALLGLEAAGAPQEALEKCRLSAEALGLTRCTDKFGAKT
ncbi:MAG: hypothetical protein LBS62_01695 [Clostridiales bacterium]|jgi:N-acetylglucosamine kinase-like BadF-type ATPase|nr:hypothetical protein [Clostridiales bacterium]